MGTKGKGPGSQHNPRGVNQGFTLVDPKSGNPIDTVTDTNGIKRLAVDGNFVAQNVQATVELDYNEDSVSIGDDVSGNKLKIENDGSINANIESDAADGDSIMVVGTEDATPSGTQHTLLVDSDKNLHVEVHGNDETGVDRPILLSTLGEVGVGRISTLNATTTLLLANATYTGTFEEVKNYSFLTFFISSNVASAVNGLEFHWTDDPTFTVWRTELTNLTANSPRSFAFGIRARYFRVKYTNGATNQSSFIIGTVFHQNGTGIITKPLKGSVTEDNFAQLTQSPVMARLKNGNFINIAGITLNSTGILGVGDTTAIMGNEGTSFKTSTNRLSTGSTVEVPYLLIDNPVGSGKIIRLDKFIFVGPVDPAATVSYKIYMSPTITANGTPLNKTGNRQTGQDVGVGNFYSLPTASANGTFNFILSVSGAAPPFIYDLEHGTLIEPGFKMLVTAQQTKSTDAGAVNIEYSETVL